MFRRIHERSSDWDSLKNRLSSHKHLHLQCTAVDLGLVEAVGVCNYKAAQLQQFHSLMDVRGIPVASNQVCCGGVAIRLYHEGVSEDLGIALEHASNQRLFHAASLMPLIVKCRLSTTSLRGEWRRMAHCKLAGIWESQWWRTLPFNRGC